MHGAYLCAARCCHHSVDVSPEMTPAVQFLGGEEFLAFFLTAGMVSSLASYAGRLRSLTGPTYSLGASGALCACFAAVAIIYSGMRNTTRWCTCS